MKLIITFFIYLGFSSGINFCPWFSRRCYFMKKVTNRLINSWEKRNQHFGRWWLYCISLHSVAFSLPESDYVTKTHNQEQVSYKTNVKNIYTAQQDSEMFFSGKKLSLSAVPNTNTDFIPKLVFFTDSLLNKIYILL